MYNIVDYVTWRGDLPFSVMPMNPVDAMVFCNLIYYNFDRFVPSDFDSEPIMVAEACKAPILDPLPNYCTENDIALQELMKTSLRFGQVRFTGFRNIIDEERGMQFCAGTFLLDNRTSFIAFRGTDNSLVGWKENMDLAYDDEVPAQTEAVKYLKEAAKAVRGALYVGGHSKGGNLAVYASAFCNKKERTRIKQIYNFDGPGFNDAVIANERFSEISDRTNTFVPQDSMVGLLLEHKEDYVVIHSSESNGLKQHNLSTWQVTPFDIVRDDSLTKNGENYQENVSEWIASMTKEEKEAFIRVLYDLVDDFKTTDELFSAKNILKIIKEYRSLPDEDRKSVSGAVGALRDTVRENRKEKRDKKKEEKKEEKALKKERRIEKIKAGLKMPSTATDRLAD